MTNTIKRDILMTTALPYANGLLHLGHVLEAIQSDIWARYQRLCGNTCLSIDGSDAHGSAMMISAEKQGVSPEELVESTRKDHLHDFQQFLISFDNFHTTHSPENQKLTNEIYAKLVANSDISKRTISHAFDPEKQMFLADRFIKGTCPRCNTHDQYGDNCESCGATYAVNELKNAKSIFSNATPIEKNSEHYFFDLSKYTDMLHQWIHSDRHLSTPVANKLEEWFGEKLREWDISRDAPYFGFEIPGAPGKYFYVWLDAPIGYMASLVNLIEKRPEINFDHYWNKNSTTELYHFIGKDIVYFHSLFWPAMLYSAGYRLPTSIFVHGYLTINGTKMSKSRGTFITAKQYLAELDPEYLRYYFAAKLNNQVEDIDLNLEDFALRVNSDLVGKYVNLASRCAGFISKKFDGMLADQLHDKTLFEEAATAGDSIAKHYESLNYNQAMREIMAVADRANQYIDHHKPWSLAKEEGKEREVQLICTQGLNLFKLLTTYLKPVLPKTAEKVEAFLNTAPLTWDSKNEALLKHQINQFIPLMQRVTAEQLEAIVAP